MEQAKRFRGIAIERDGHPTKVGIAELTDGSFEVVLVTERVGAESVTTPFRISPATLSMLSDALFIAAHHPESMPTIE